MAENDLCNDTGTSCFAFPLSFVYPSRRTAPSPDPKEAKRILKQIESKEAMERQTKQARSKRFVPRF